MRKSEKQKNTIHFTFSKHSKDFVTKITVPGEKIQRNKKDGIEAKRKTAKTNFICRTIKRRTEVSRRSRSRSKRGAFCGHFDGATDASDSCSRCGISNMRRRTSKCFGGCWLIDFGQFSTVWRETVENCFYFFLKCNLSNKIGAILNKIVCIATK